MSKRNYTREFKVSAVQLVTQQDYTPAAAAMSLSLTQDWPPAASH